MFNPIDALEDPINGDRFVEIADYWWNDRETRSYSSESGKWILRAADYMPPEMDERNAILFCRTDNLPDLFNRLSHANGKYVLITHNSDINITAELYATKPDNVVGWFAQNVLTRQKRLIPIPIGLERPSIARSGDINDFRANLMKPITKDLKLYINFSNGTNKEREPLKEKFRDKEWATIQDEPIPFAEYLAEVRRHKYVLSPPGNGWDCHRTWEALYCGSIPIVSISKRLPAEGMYPVGYYTYEDEDDDDDKTDVCVYTMDSVEMDYHKLYGSMPPLTFTWWANLIRWYSKEWMR
jgi:hypothetical protein